MTAAIAEPLALLPTETTTPPPRRPAPCGPGWFDSSWELRAGLRVEEGLPADLPLHGWLEAWLQIVGGGAPSPSLSAT
jgi:hypothetical protein